MYSKSDKDDFKNDNYRVKFPNLLYTVSQQYETIVSIVNL